jgi:ABC-2 type transport system ATP-binding protein
MSAIEVNNLVKYYGNTKALDGITFNLEKGEVLAFLGPNGAGKTTTMKIITCYLRASGGNVKVNGLNVDEYPVKVREMIGYLPESTPLYGDMIVYDFLKFTGKIHNINSDKLESRIREMADTCGINEVIGKRIYQLSKGYKQRVGLAYAMIHDPEILILDEPTSGLDPNQIIEIRNLIKELGKKKSIILSTHILSEAEAAAERAIIIDRGLIVADGTVDQIRKNNKNETHTILTIKKNGTEPKTIRNKLNSINGIKNVEERTPFDNAYSFELISKLDVNMDNVYNLCKNENYTILEMKEKELTLEDIFRKLTKGEEIQ